VRGSEGVQLSYSGLDQSEACWVRRLANGLGTSVSVIFLTLENSYSLAGIGLAPNFTRRSTHLLCPEHKGAKFEKATEWCIPVVGMTWLEEMAKSGVVPAVTSRTPAEISYHSPANALSTPAPLTKGKGKERERAGGNGMIDFTNGWSTASQYSDRLTLRPPDAPRGASVSSPDEPSQAFDPPAPIPPALSDRASEDSDDGSFGPPGALLGGGPAPVPPPLSPSTPPPSSSRSVSHFQGSDDGVDCLQFGSNRLRSSADMADSFQDEGSESRTSEVLHAFMPGVVPAGSGLPASSVFRAGSAPTSSSAKAVQDEDTRGLQEEIANLLGKRTTDMGEGPLRPGKRSRPLAKTRVRYQTSRFGWLEC
jgi:DNA replication regulator DPB11